MPLLTTDDVASGVIGLTVVRSRRNAMTPATVAITPSPASVSAMARRPGSAIESAGAARAAPNMISAKASATSSGGNLSSSHFMGSSSCDGDGNAEQKRVRQQVQHSSERLERDWIRKGGQRQHDEPHR